ncbi:MAG: metal-dependent hydrolase [Candidatus Binatia bacterium]
MDIVTHGITGVLVSRALPSGHRGSMMMAGLIGALAPDVDVVASSWDPLAAITVHRTVTHSFLGGGIVALVAVALVWRFSHESIFRLLGVAYLGVLSHIGLDLLTPFGTAILWPLTARRFSLEQHHVIDPVLSALALGFLVLTFWLKGRRNSLAKAGLAGMAFYIIVTGAYQGMALVRWQAFLQSQEISPIRSTVIPLAPGPFRWLGVAETKDVFYQHPFWVYGPDLKPPLVFSKTNGNFDELNRRREVQSFLGFARFPWRHEFREGPNRVIEYRDLAFADHPLGGPWSLRIWVDESGSVEKMEFGHLF